MPPGVGAENLVLIYGAAQRIREPIAALKPDLPDVSAALGAAGTAILSACAGCLTAISDFQEVTTKQEAEVNRLAEMMARREEALDPTAPELNGDTVARAVGERAKKVRGTLYADWMTRYEQGKEQLSLKVGSEVVTKLEAAATAVERAELRAGLDTAAPDGALVASVERTVMAEPTLRRPTKVRELLDRAMKLEDAALMLALESQIPTLQQVIEQGVPALTRNTQHRTGMSSDAMTNAVATVSLLRALRDQRLAQPAITKAREILAALQWLSMKTVGRDASDPAVVASLRGVTAPTKLMADGARWPTRYIRSTAALRWPPMLAAMPAANLTSEPEVIRPAAPAVLPMRTGEPNPLRAGKPSAARRASGRE